MDSASQFTAGEKDILEILFLFSSKYSDQLAELGKVSLARILCDNSDIETMQPDAFRLVSTRYQSVAARAVIVLT